MTFLATEEYWKNFYSLSPEQKAATRAKWTVFKVDPFHPSLGTHKIHKLSAAMRRTVYSVVIEGNLRVIFRRDGDVVTTLDIGTHDLYR